MVDPLSPELALFLESGVSIQVGSRDARRLPEVTRALGARIEAGGRELTVFLPVTPAERTLANARDNGRLAVCFSAIDHCSYQIKGRFVAVRDADEQDRRAIERYRGALAQVYGAVGMPPRLTYRIGYWPACAVRIEIESVFLQTPGPGAGVVFSEPARGKRA